MLFSLLFENPLDIPMPFHCEIINTHLSSHLKYCKCLFCQILQIHKKKKATPPQKNKKQTKKKTKKNPQKIYSKSLLILTAF